MHVIVLGSAAGGGVPQWNCACQQCEAARYGNRVKARTQDSLAVSANGHSWVLLNASPDVRQQIARTRSLWPSSDPGSLERRSPIAAIITTNGDLDHCLGLFHFREWTPFSFYATRQTYAGLVETNAVMRTLSRQRPHLEYRPLALAEQVSIVDANGVPTDLSVTAFAVAGKLPLHLETLQTAGPETNVGLLVEQGAAEGNGPAKRLLYVPSAGLLTDVAEIAEHVDCLFFDGTFWSDDELRCHEASARSAKEMAHWPVGGASGSLKLLSTVNARLKFYTHLNNTNPMLMRGSREAALVNAAGWEIAEDGREVLL